MNALPNVPPPLVKSKSVFASAIGVLGSLGLSCSLLALLLLITWLGTMAQQDVGLFAAQKKYFDSLSFVEQWSVDLPFTDAKFGPFPILLPGAYTVLALLLVNLVIGGIVRIRKSAATAGIIITHIGIIVMIVAGFVKFHYSVDGAMRIDPGQSASAFQSYHEWELAIARPDANGTERVWLVPDADLSDLDGAQSRTFRHAELPFTVTLSAYAPNGYVRPAASGNPRRARVVDGFYVDPQPIDPEHERNDAASYIDIAVTKDGSRHEGILWGSSRSPLVVQLDGTAWTFDLRKRRFELPFSVRLDRFVKDDHPGSMMVRDFRSFVTRTDGEIAQGVEISMNEPMRHGGYIFYQSSWGPQGPNVPPGTPFYTVLSVVDNPSDQWPLISCCIIAAGMLFHFVRKLGLFARRLGARS